MPSCWLSKLFWFPVLFIFQIFCFDFSSLFGEAFTLEILLLRKAQHLKPRSLYKILCDVAAGQVPNRIHLTAEEIASECGSDGIAFARNCIDLLIPKKKAMKVEMSTSQSKFGGIGILWICLQIPLEPRFLSLEYRSFKKSLNWNIYFKENMFDDYKKNIRAIHE